MQLLLQHIDYIVFLLLAGAFFFSLKKLWKNGFLPKALSEQDGLGSSKRFTVFVFVVLLVLLYLYTVILNRPVDFKMFTLLAGIICAGLGITVLPDIFSKKSTDE